jgi:hypothetical protein
LYFPLLLIFWTNPTDVPANVIVATWHSMVYNEIMEV